MSSPLPRRLPQRRPCSPPFRAATPTSTNSSPVNDCVPRAQRIGRGSKATDPSLRGRQYGQQSIEGDPPSSTAKGGHPPDATVRPVRHKSGPYQARLARRSTLAIHRQIHTTPTTPICRDPAVRPEPSPLARIRRMEQ